MPIHATSDLADSSPWRLLCDDFENYPRNLAPRLGNPIVLQQQGAKLRDDERRLFNTTRSNIYMTELLSGSHGSLFSLPSIDSRITRTLVNCVAQTQGENIRPSQCLVLQERPQDQVPPGTQPYHGSCAQNLEFTGIRDLKKHLQYPFENAKKDTAMRHM